MRITSIGNKNREYFLEITGEMRKDQIGIGLTEDGYAIGAALISVDEYICNLDWIFVRPEFRRKGGGTLLVNSIVDTMKDIGFDSFMAFYSANDDITAFLEKNGFCCTPDSVIHTYKIEDVFRAKNVCRLISKKPPENIIPLSRLDRMELNKLTDKLEQLSYSDVLMESGSYEPDLSFVERQEDGQLASVLLSKYEDDTVYISLLLSFGISNHVAMKMISAFLLTVMNCGKNIEKFSFYDRNENVFAAIKLLMEKAGEPLDVSLWSAIRFELDGGQ